MSKIINWFRLHSLMFLGIFFLIAASIVSYIIYFNILAMEKFRITEFNHFSQNLSLTAKEIMIREDGFVMLATMMKTITDMSHVRYIEYYQGQGSAMKSGNIEIADVELIEKLKALNGEKTIKNKESLYVRKELPRYDVLEEKGSFYIIFDLKEYINKRRQILLAIVLVLIFAITLTSIMFLLERRNMSLINTQMQLEREKSKSTNMIKAITHDAKHYLTVINLRLNGLLRQYQRGMEIENPEEDLQLALDNTKAINTFLDSLVEDERILSGEEKLTPEPVNTLLIVNEVIQDARAQLKSKHIRCDILSDGKIPGAWIDPKALKRTLMNLLLNAIKFSPEHSVIRVSIKKRGNRIWFEVRDQGKGIESKDWEHIFEPFVRLDSKIKGTGQGLTTSRRLIELSGGQLKVVNSVPGQGTTFRFSLLMAK